jgi:hypothetical protein
LKIRSGERIDFFLLNKDQKRLLVERDHESVKEGTEGGEGDWERAKSLFARSNVGVVVARIERSMTKDTGESSRRDPLAIHYLVRGRAIPWCLT